MPRVLVVEDDPAHLQLATYLLERNGWAVLPAGTAEEGLALARRELPDMVLMDLSLPGMDGITAIRELRRDRSTRALRVIAQTSYSDDITADAARAAGADGFLEKPFDYGKFLAILNTRQAGG